MSEGFFGRWSRRKREAAQEEDLAQGLPQRTQHQDKAQAAPDQRTAPLPDDGGASGAVQTRGQEPAPAAPLPTLKDVQQLTPQSDFQPFMQRGVGAEVRNAAMKKLFADPHFNVMDGLDIYIGDYSQPDPMPAGMLRKMVSAHTMGFFDHEKKQDEAAMTAPGGRDASATPADGAAAGPRDDAGVQTDPDVAQLPAANADPSVSLSPPDPAAASAPDPLAPSASHTRHDDQDAHLRL
jgi:hypothetical protein